MAKNEFLPFGTAEGANVLSNQEYEALAARHNGFNSGVAKSKELNKVWRQASLIASAVAQFIVDTDQKDLLDTGDVADIKSRLASAINLIISNGDYVTNPYLKLELLKKIDKVDITQQLGNDTDKVVSQNLLATELGKKASVADANSKLAKDQNGADIPDKPKFIENLGLSELFSPLSIFYTEGGYAVIKTGEVYDHFAVKGGMFGSYNPQVDQWNFQMPVTGPEQTVGAYKNRVMSQFAVSEALKKKLNTDDVVHGTGNSESKVISQKATTVAIDEIYSKMFGVGMTFRDVTAERTVGTNYVNSSLKPRVIYFVGMPAQATTNTLTATGKINDKTVVQFKDASATAGDIRSFILVVPPGASYSCHSVSHTVSGFNYWFEWE